MKMSEQEFEQVLKSIVRLLRELRQGTKGEN